MDNLSTGLRIWNITQCHILTGFILCKNMVRNIYPLKRELDYKNHGKMPDHVIPGRTRDPPFIFYISICI